MIYPLNTSMDLQGDILRVQIIVKCICINLKREIHVYIKKLDEGRVLILLLLKTLAYNMMCAF